MTDVTIEQERVKPLLLAEHVLLNDLYTLSIGSSALFIDLSTFPALIKAMQDIYNDKNQTK